MIDNNKYKKTRSRIQVFSILTILIVTLIWFFQSFLVPFNNDTNNQLHTNWQIAINNKNVYTGRISDYKFNNIKKGDVITFLAKVNIEQYDTSIMLSVPFSTIKCYQNHKLIYDFKSYDKFTPTAVIEIPVSSGNQEMKIVAKPSINEPFRNIGDFTLIEEGTVNEKLIMNAPNTLLFSGFLIILGIILVVLSFTLIKHLYPILAIGLYSFFGGLWILCCSKIIQVFSQNYLLNSYIEYYSLYLCGAAFCLLQYSFIKDNKYRKKLYPLIISMSVFSFLSIILSYLNIFDIKSPLVYFQAFEAIENLIFIIALLLGSPKSNDHTIINIAFIVHFIYGFLDAIRYNLEHYTFARESFIGVTYTQYGLLILIILMVYAFIIKNEEKIRIQSEKNAWQTLAYTDTLTKLNTRLYFADKMKELLKKPKDYTIIFMDLNKLKKVNDKYSHINGDLYIKDFAHFLKSHFKDAFIISRLGGDEFIIVYDHCDQKKIKHLMDNIQDKELEASRHKDFPLDASFGIAFSHEGHSLKDVIDLADKRMYKMKNSLNK